MIFLGVDYGFSRIGVAKSDEGGVMAFPYDTISSKKNLQEDAISIVEIAKKIGSKKIIIGMPINMNGTQSSMGLKIKQLSSKISQIYMCEIKFWDERLTTVQANRIIQDNRTKKNGTSSIDSISAALILGSYLEAKKGRKSN